MSLINDALKRAKEAQRINTPASLPPMRPVEARVEVRRTERKNSLVVPVLVVFLIIGALAFIGLALARHTTINSDKAIATAPETTAPATVAPVTAAPAQPAPQPVIVATVPTLNPPASVSPAPNPTVAATPDPNPPAPILPVAATAPSVTPTPVAPPVEVASPAVIPTEPHIPTLVQGIAFDSAHPWAIINGRTVNVGDYVSGGMRVMDISHHSVTLVGHGRTNNLVVGQQ